MPFASTASVTIRDSRPGDIPAIADIYAEAVKNGTGTFEIDPPDAAEITRRRDALMAGSYPYLVAEEEEKVIGYCYAGAFRARPAYRFSVEDSVYVAPAYHGRKIGRRLMEALIERCEKADYRQMIAVIGDSDNRASIGLHAALGFRHTGVLPAAGWKFGRWVDVVFMVRALGPGAGQPARDGR